MKLCIIPGQQPIRLATINGGHTMYVGEELVEVPEIFVREAKSKGAITEAELKTLKKRLAGEKVEDAPGPGAPLEPGDDSALQQVIAASIEILNRGDVAEVERESGKPSIEALSALTGFQVTAEDRDKAFAKLSKVPK